MLYSVPQMKLLDDGHMAQHMLARQAKTKT